MQWIRNEFDFMNCLGYSFKLLIFSSFFLNFLYFLMKHHFRFNFTSDRSLIYFLEKCFCHLFLVFFSFFIWSYELTKFSLSRALEQFSRHFDVLREVERWYFWRKKCARIKSSWKQTNKYYSLLGIDGRKSKIQ